MSDGWDIAQENAECIAFLNGELHKAKADNKALAAELAEANRRADYATAMRDGYRKAGNELVAELKAERDEAEKHATTLRTAVDRLTEMDKIHYGLWLKADRERDALRAALSQADSIIDSYDPGSDHCVDILDRAQAVIAEALRGTEVRDE